MDILNLDTEKLEILLQEFLKLETPMLLEFQKNLNLEQMRRLKFIKKVENL